MPDYPDFSLPTIPAQELDVAPTIGSFWSQYDTVTIAGSSTEDIDIEPPDDGYYYKINLIMITNDGDYPLSAILTLDGISFMGLLGQPSLLFPVHANPLVVVGYGDKFTLSITNRDSSSHDVEYVILATKMYMPGGFARVPIAAFSATPLSGNCPLTVAFTDESYRFPTSWLWDFGDGSAPSSEHNPSHVYASAGIYDVRLYATNAVGTDTLLKADYIAVTALQDLTGYTEYDPYGRLTIASTKCTLTGGYRNQNWNLYKDFGANYFDGIDIDFEMRLTSCTTWASMSVIGISNSTGDSASWASTDYLVFMARTGTSDYRITLLSGDGSVSDYMAAAVNVTYYCTLRRAAGSNSVYLDVYSDSDRLTLLDTLVITGIGSTKHRYIHAMVSRYGASSAAASGWVDHIYLA